MRILTGARKGTSHSNLYIESGWISLDERRKFLKLINFLKLENHNAPTYMTDLLPRKPLAKNE